MKIVVLAGGTSTERDVSIVSGTGICGALRQKGHQAILVDVFCGQEEVDWEDPFPAEYDVEKAAAYIRGFNLQMAELKKTRKKYCKKTIRNCTIILLPICVYVLYEKILGNLFTVSLGYAVLNIIILEVIYVFSCFCVEIQELQE